MSRSIALRALIISVSIARGGIKRKLLGLTPVFIAMAFLNASGLYVWAQAADEAGIKPFATLQGGPVEDVNLSNHTINLHPTLLSYPQRGGKLQFNLIVQYTNATWEEKETCFPGIPKVCDWFWIPDQGGAKVNAVLSRGVPAFFTEALDTTTNPPLAYFVKLSDGSTHPAGQIGSSLYETIDSTGILLNTSTADITFPDGVRANPNNFTMTDPNGNEITQSSSGWVDTMGRNIPGPPATNGNIASGGVATSDFSHCTGELPINSAALWTVPGPNGGVSTYKFCFVKVHVFTNHWTTDDSTHIELNSDEIEIQSIVLPDNTAWTFDYSQPDANGVNWGDLVKITYPTGGSISYVWATFHGCSVSHTFTDASYRGVTQRIVDANDGTGPQTWAYSGNTVTDPSGNDTVHTFTNLSGCSFYETETQTYNGSLSAGNLIETVNTQYSWNPNPNTPTGAFPPPPTAINVVASNRTTTLANGLVKQTSYSYDPGFAYTDAFGGSETGLYGKVMSQIDTDWGRGSPGLTLRETDTQYQFLTDTLGTYKNLNLLDTPNSVIVRDGANNVVAKTTYGYDEPFNGISTEPTSITTQHTTVGAVRGNRSSTTKWLLSSNTPVTSRTFPYDTGEPYQAIDPNGNTTTYSYDSAYVGGFQTMTCRPTTGTVPHCVSGTYDSNTGHLLSFTDENAAFQASGTSQGDPAHTITYTYSDPLGRLTAILYPADSAGHHPQTTFSYSAAGVLPVSVRQLRTIVGATEDDSTTYFDGLGREFKTVHTSAGGATVLKTYDSTGRVASVTNPYVSGSDPTYGVARYTYDPLGRMTKATKQDGGSAIIDYTQGACPSGFARTYTDEAGDQRRTCSDALGHVTEVEEPALSLQNVVVQYRTTMQTDGNLALYDESNNLLWSNGMASGPGVYFLRLRDDGNVIEYGPYWATHTVQPAGDGTATGCSGSTLDGGQELLAGQCLLSSNHRFMLWMQTDGNLVAYDMNVTPMKPLWSTGTAGQNVAYATMQIDGNLVLYGPNNNAVWASNTATSLGNFFLWMQTDGNLVIYNGLWATNTSQTQSSQTFSSIGCSGNVLNLGQTLTTGMCLVSTNNRFQLLQQTDGNLVLYDRLLNPTPSISSALWSTHTFVTPMSSAVTTKTFYSYDALGNLTCVEQHGDAASGTGCSSPASSDATSPWRVRRFGYDSLSRLISSSNPETNTYTSGTGSLARSNTVYFYDNNGNVLQKTSPAPNQTGSTVQTISYCYDALNRVTGKAYSSQTCQNGQLPAGTAAASYMYDQSANGIGQRTGMTDASGSSTWAYDALGRMISWQRTVGSATKTIGYSYNLDNSLASITYPSNAVVTYAPDAAGRPVSAVDTANSINYVTNTIYNAANLATSFVSGASATFAGTTNSFTYNERLQPITIQAATSSQTLLNLTYDFHDHNGNNGNVWAVANGKDANRSLTFTYDTWNRLTSAQNAGTDCSKSTVNGRTEYWGNSYGYDPWGNLTQKTVSKCSAENLSISASANNQLTGYTYDAAGSMISDPSDGVSIIYDAENRISSVSKGGVTTTYTYDGDGNRVEKTSGGTGTLYWYGLPGVLAESDLTGTIKSEYVFFNGQRVARRDEAAPAGVYYYFSDFLKSASVVTDASGNIRSESDYYPWGGELQMTNADSNHFKFTGKERDSESGLDYFGARFYSAALGRFMSPDWSQAPTPVPYADLSDPQSLNLYSYVRNSPVARIDADGHFVTSGGSAAGGQPCADGTDSCHTSSQTFDLGNGEALTVTTTTTTTFNKDGSADVKATTTTTLTQTDPKTGKTTTRASLTSKQTFHIDRDTEGKIIVNGKIAPRSWGDSIEQSAKVLEMVIAPHESLAENSVHEVGRAIDFSRSDEGASMFQRFADRWNKFWSIEQGDEIVPAGWRVNQ